MCAAIEPAKVYKGIFTQNVCSMILGYAILKCSSVKASSVDTNYIGSVTLCTIFSSLVSVILHSQPTSGFWFQRSPIVSVKSRSLASVLLSKSAKLFVMLVLLQPLGILKRTNYSSETAEVEFLHTETLADAVHSAAELSRFCSLAYSNLSIYSVSGTL